MTESQRRVLERLHCPIGLMRVCASCYAASPLSLRNLVEMRARAARAPEKITIDKSGANTAAIAGVRADSGADIEMLPSKHPLQATCRSSNSLRLRLYEACRQAGSGASMPTSLPRWRASPGWAGHDTPRKSEQQARLRLFHPR